MYALPSLPTARLWPGIRYAASALKLMLDGDDALMKGSLSIMSVRNWLEREYVKSAPMMVLLTGSSPMLTFWVNGRSLRFKNVAPKASSSLGA